MIISTLKDSARVEALSPAFKKLFDYIKTHDLLNVPPGRIELDGNNLFINNMETTGEPVEKRPIELHKKYIDVHILLEGKERIGWVELSTIKTVKDPYNEKIDMALYSDPCTCFVDLLPGQFAVIYPEDPHAPMIGQGKIRKLIAKIKL